MDKWLERIWLLMIAVVAGTVVAFASLVILEEFGPTMYLLAYIVMSVSVAFGRRAEVGDE